MNGVAVLSLFPRGGSILLAHVLLSLLTTAVQAQVTIDLQPATPATTVGQTVDVAVRVVAGSNQVDAAGSYLNFDPTLLQVVSVTTGAAFPIVVQNSFDNTLGQTFYAAGIGQPNTVTGTVTLCSIRFQGIAVTTGTPLVFNTVDPRKTEAVLVGVSYAGPLNGGTIVVTPAATPTGTAPTPTTPATATHTPTASPTRTQTPTPTPFVTMVLQPSAATCNLGSTVDVAVAVNAVTHPVDTAGIYINFDPTLVQVVSITAGTTLPVVVQSTFDNALGQINYAATILASTVTGTFTVFTVRFQGIAPTAGTPLTFNVGDPLTNPVGLALPSPGNPTRLFLRAAVSSSRARRPHPRRHRRRRRRWSLI